jgi:proton-dependent oligopeptide transporter, POT family
VDAPPKGVSRQGSDKAERTPTTPGGMFARDSHTARANAMDMVPEWKRIAALIVIYLIVIVFWMVFHQNGSTLTYWADKNTDWNVSGTISNAINPFWVVTLTFPLVWFWKWLDNKGKEPSTPTKMAVGMTLTGLSFFILYFAAKMGEASVTSSNPYAFKVSPAWLITSYAVVTLGELMLSPMGLALVSKVAPIRMRGLMMGGWFVATAAGNKLTMIGVYWDRWLHSTFFAVLGAAALFMAVVLFLLLKPLKKAMPGV